MCFRIRKVYFNVFRDFRKYEKENFVFGVLFWLVFWLGLDLFLVYCMVTNRQNRGSRYATNGKTGKSR